MAVYLGLRHRLPLSDKIAVNRAKGLIEKEASEIANEFMRRFGSLTCIDLVKVDFSDPKVRLRPPDPSLSRDTCDRFVVFVIDKLYELEESGGSQNVA
jgi:hypothetical protein